MSVIETKHTRSRLNVIKRDLFKAVTVFSCISMLAFLSYYIYLIIENVHNPLYLVVYSVLIVAIVSLFFVEALIREDKKLLRNEKRISTEKKRKYKFVIKVFKFVAKFVLVGVAIYETVTNFDINISNIVNICSAVLLGVQIIFEFIISKIIKQIDYLRLSVELDIEESGIFKTILAFMVKEKELEKKAIIEQGGIVHTPMEEKMIAEIREDAKEYEVTTKTRKKKIRSLLPSKLEKLKFWKKWKKSE